MAVTIRESKIIWFFKLFVVCIADSAATGGRKEDGQAVVLQSAGVGDRRGKLVLKDSQKL